MRSCSFSPVLCTHREVLRQLRPPTKKRNWGGVGVSPNNEFGESIKVLVLRRAEGRRRSVLLQEEPFLPERFAFEGFTQNRWMKGNGAPSSSQLPVPSGAATPRCGSALCARLPSVERLAHFQNFPAHRVPCANDPDLPQNASPPVSLISHLALSSSASFSHLPGLRRLGPGLSSCPGCRVPTAKVTLSVILLKLLDLLIDISLCVPPRPTLPLPCSPHLNLGFQGLLHS